MLSPYERNFIYPIHFDFPFWNAFKYGNKSTRHRTEGVDIGYHFHNKRKFYDRTYNNNEYIKQKHDFSIISVVERVRNRQFQNGYNLIFEHFYNILVIFHREK